MTTVMETPAPTTASGMAHARIALVGCPNSGKTTLFNALTGSRQKTGNYPGVTVERKEGFLPAYGLSLLDLPGLYSLAPKSPDEKVTAAVISGSHRDEPRPDAIVAVADATQLKRQLYLITELRELRVPMVLALTMNDLAEAQKIKVDAKELSKRLGIPVVLTTATKGRGLDNLVRTARVAAETGRRAGPAPASAAPLPRSPDFIAARYKFVDELMDGAVKRLGPSEDISRRIDDVVLHRFWGPVILIAAFALLFELIFKGAELPSELIETGIAALGSRVEALLPEGALRDLVVNGIIAGVGSVVVFLPQILILFSFIILFEDSGYMARAAFILDRMMARFGLSGRSFIPLLSSFACAIPGIMATRTIESKRDRFATIMIAPLMTCSARVPVYTLLVAAFMPSAYQGLTLFGLYLGGILMAMAVSVLLGRTVLKGASSPFLLEMPTYKVPSLKNLALGLYDRSRVFLKRAGTIILGCSIALWALATYPRSPQVSDDPKVQSSYALEHSALGRAGKAIEPLVKPLGYDWRLGIGILSSFAAREVILSTLGTVYAVEAGEGAEDRLADRLKASSDPTSGRAVFGIPTVLSLLVFYMLACQCMSTLAVVRRETNSWRWPALMFAYMTILAYAAAFCTYRAATMLGGA